MMVHIIGAKTLASDFEKNRVDAIVLPTWLFYRNVDHIVISTKNYFVNPAPGRFLTGRLIEWLETHVRNHLQQLIHQNFPPLFQQTSRLKNRLHKTEPATGGLKIELFFYRVQGSKLRRSWELRLYIWNRDDWASEKSSPRALNSILF